MKKEEEFDHSPIAKYVAEFIGTYFLVTTVGCNVNTGSIAAGVSIGAMLMVMIYALGSVSGAHLNPAVTLSLQLSCRNKIDPVNMVCYMASQCAGGLLGALTYWLVTGAAFIQQPTGLFTKRNVFAVELIYSWALCYVVLNVATTTNKETGNGKNSFFGLAIGFTVAAAAIAVGPISGCSLNPAVSIGSLFVAYLQHGSAALDFSLLYVFAPLVGAVLGAGSFWLVQGGARGKFEYASSKEEEIPLN